MQKIGLRKKGRKPNSNGIPNGRRRFSFKNNTKRNVNSARKDVRAAYANETIGI